MILRCTTSRRRPWHLAAEDLGIVREILATLLTDDGETVGTSSMSLLRLADCERIGASAFEVLDEHSIELMDFVPLVADYGWSTATIDWLDDMPGLEPDHLLIARNTTLEPAWRGQGLAVPFAAASLLAATRGRHCLAAMIPAPPLSDDGPDIGSPEHDTEVARLTSRWAPLGYQPMITFGDDRTFAIHCLDVNEAVDNLRAIVTNDGRIDRARRHSDAVGRG